MGLRTTQDINAIQRQQRVSEAMALRVKGFSLQEIADQLGISPSTASNWIREAIEAGAWEVQTKANELREVVLQRNDQLIKMLLDKVESDQSLSAIDRIAKLQDQSLQLVGANAPQRVQHEGGLNIAQLSNEQLEDLVSRAVADLSSSGYEVITLKEDQYATKS